MLIVLLKLQLFKSDAVATADFFEFKINLCVSRTVVLKLLVAADSFHFTQNRCAPLRFVDY